KGAAVGGVAMCGAKVDYRGVREVQFPHWWAECFWWRPVPAHASHEMAHGTAATTDDGSFSVEFVAKPDASVSEKDEPTFQYSIYADVTDTTGETRSAQRAVNVGYTALRASLTANEWLTDDKPAEIRIVTES